MDPTRRKREKAFVVIPRERSGGGLRLSLVSLRKSSWPPQPQMISRKRSGRDGLAFPQMNPNFLRQAVGTGAVDWNSFDIPHISRAIKIETFATPLPTQDPVPISVIPPPSSSAPRRTLQARKRRCVTRSGTGPSVLPTSPILVSDSVSNADNSSSSVPSSVEMSRRPFFRCSQNAPGPSSGRVRFHRRMSRRCPRLLFVRACALRLVFSLIRRWRGLGPFADLDTMAETPPRTAMVRVVAGPSSGRILTPVTSRLLMTHVFRHVKQAGCSILVVKNLHLRRPYVKLTSALGKAMEAVNAYAAEAESRFRNVPRKGQGVVVELEEKLRAAREQVDLVKEKSMGALWQANDMAVLNRELEVENRSQKESGDTIARKVNCAGRQELAGWFKEILESIREKFHQEGVEATGEIKLQELVANLDLLEDLAKKEVIVESETACMIALRLAEEAAFQRSIVSDFSLGKLAPPQISEDSNAAVIEVDSATLVPARLDQHGTNELAPVGGLAEEEMVDGE
ncbi:hypothetical protein AALP_AA6G090400 [Arabis alpina]|uniref:Uncharacterized protein n=1 Tax=Arabis alpina TaxID=50452 RepID=A0A087GN16_ARAAL|nr:hypothetical protein AALP_AA6G090400 [Arabis alpina]